MLSLMYSGDMCYWIWELSDSSHADTPADLATETGTTVNVKSKKVHSDAAEKNCQDIDVDSSSHTTDVPPPSASSSSHLATPPTSAHVEGNFESSDGDRTCTDNSNTITTAGGGGTLSTSPTPSNESTEEVMKKLEAVELDSTRTLEPPPTSSPIQEPVSPSQEAPPSSQEVGKGCQVGVTRTVNEAPQAALDLYHVMWHTCGEEGVSRWLSDFDPHKCGLEMLSKYIDAARGPLKGQGWEYSRAVKLMVQLKRAAAATHIK